jgi:hypothetical protein
MADGESGFRQGTAKLTFYEYLHFACLAIFAAAAGSRHPYDVVRYTTRPLGRTVTRKVMCRFTSYCVLTRPSLRSTMTVSQPCAGAISTWSIAKKGDSSPRHTADVDGAVAPRAVRRLMFRLRRYA